MMRGLTRRIFGTANERVVKAYAKRVDAINGFEATLETLSDAELRGLTDQLRERLDKNSNLDAILHEAFATVREAAKRTLGQRHYDVQLIGGMVLHEARSRKWRPARAKPSWQPQQSI